ncbi:putative disease resistance protein RGA4 [Bienertia sinuspersici]
MGKTTLAKQVYENKRVASHFNERMWIFDLEGFNIKTVLNLMVKGLRKGNYEDASRQTAIETLREHLGGRRYLLVLDDVWNTNIDLWNSMRYALEDIGGSKDSMVLITTRDDAVVKAMDPSSVHPLSRLSEPNSWRIVAKCKGVPLAIRSIAGVLYHKKNLREWMKIEESELWYVLRNETNNRTGVLAILKLSYDHLPSKLKKCFCLCAHLPKGWLVEKYDLIGRWMALGLLETSIDENLTMEDVGERYLSALVLDIQHLTTIGYAEITSDFPDKLVLKNIRSLDMLKNLPRGLLEDVKYLRVLWTIEQLSQLQTLPPLQLSEGGFQISELGCLPDLKGTLDIKGLEFVKSKLDAEGSKLSTKLRVEQLQLSWEDDGNCRNQEESLKELHLDQLFVLEEWCEPGPEAWIGYPSLELSENRDTPDLAGLSSLMGLNVRGMSKIISDPPKWLYSLSYLRSMHIGSYEELNEFPDISPLLKMKSLKDLYLYGWKVLQSLPEQLQHFTALETLGIVGQVEEIPSKDAMKRLTNLRELRISSCPLLVSALEINGQEYHKIADACFEVRIED